MAEIIRARRSEVACATCRKRKRKCDGTRPSCSSCVALGVDCEYSGFVETRKRKPRDIEHIASLEAEIANLKLYIEGLGLPELAKTNENCGDTDLYHIGSKIRDPSKFVSCDDFGRSDNVTAIEMASSSKAGLSIAAVDEVAALVWKMDIGSAGQPEFTGPSGNFCFPSSQHKPRGSTKTLPLQKGIPSSLNKSLQIDMIDHSLSERLLSYFLNHINPYHHFLEPSTILSAKDYPSGTDALDFLYCAIFAAGACLAIDDYAKQAGDSFAAQADLVALSCCRKNPGTLCVQALTILAWRELSQERDTIAWIYNSIAGGLTLSLGLHVIGLQDLSEIDHTATQHSKDSSIRIFWSFFLLDRMATSLLGRNCIIPWRRVSVPPVLSILPSQTDVSELAFAYQCQLWHLHDQHMDQIYAFDFHALDTLHRNKLLLEARTALFQYKELLPKPLRLSSLRNRSSHNIEPSALFLNMSYEMSILLIHRPFLQEDPSSESFRVAILTMTLAASNMARNIREFYKICPNYKSNLRKSSFEVIPPHFVVHHILTASIMHLLNGTSDSAHYRSRVRRNLEVCMQFLHDLQTTWPSARKAIQQIKDLANRWGVVAILPMRFSNLEKYQAKEDSNFIAMDQASMLDHGNAGHTQTNLSSESPHPGVMIEDHCVQSSYNDIPQYSSADQYCPDWEPFLSASYDDPVRAGMIAAFNDESWPWSSSYDVNTSALNDMLDFALQNDT